MKPLAAVALVLALAGALLCGWTAVNEWNYYQDHPGRTGVSGVLTAFAVGATLCCVAVALLAIVAGRRG